MKSIYLKLTLFLIIFCTGNIYAQRNPYRKTVGVHQLDSRFTFSIEKYWSGMADSEDYYYYVKNNTADTYEIEIEVDLTLNCYDSKPYKLGYNRIVYLKPYGEFTPKDDYVHTYMISSNKEKQKTCLIPEGDTYTLYRGHTWAITKIVNITQKKEEQKTNEIQELIKAGDNAMLRQNYDGAQNNYLKVLNLDKTNQYADNQLKKIKRELVKVEAKKRFDALIDAGKSEEAKGNYANAERLYNDAAASEFNNSYAQEQVVRLNQLKAEKIKDAEATANAIKVKAETEEKIAADANEKKAATRKKFFEEKERLAEEHLKIMRDSIADSLEEEERKKLLEDTRLFEKEQDALAIAKEKNEKDELKTEALARRDEDNDEISRIEAIMKYDPIAYAESLDTADKLKNNAEDIDPWDEMDLKKEWWDNNTYIQYFADDLYEPQRRENHTKYIKKCFEAKSAFYSAKKGYLQAMQYVDKGSSEQQWLLDQIEYCHKSIDSFEANYMSDFRSEGIRIKQREDAKIMAEGQRIVDNRQKARLAYASLPRNADSPAQYLTDTYKLADRMEVAHQQYVQDMAVAGVSQSLVMNTITNNDLGIKDNGDNFMFNAHTSLEYNIVPILMNETSDVALPETTVGELTAAIANIGMDLWFYRSKYTDVNLGFAAGYGVFPMEGIRTTFLHYSAKINVDIGYNWVKLATLAQFLNRTGEQEIDYDVTLSNQGNTSPSATNRIASGNFNYNILRVGGGLKIRFLSYDDFSNFTLMVYAEKPDFYEYDILNKPVFSYALEFNGAEMGMSLEYAPNYVIAGTKEYSLPNPSNKNYVAIKLTKTWTFL